MKKRLLILMLVAFLSEAPPQTIGDYRSNAVALNWNTTARGSDGTVTLGLLTEHLDTQVNWLLELQVRLTFQTQETILAVITFN